VDLEHLIPMNLMHAGQTALVRQVLGRTEQVHRLEELGLRGGACVEMVQPGKPCIIRLGGQTLCFRADEMTSVFVAPQVAT
jgi:ferrous iron transport protein A